MSQQIYDRIKIRPLFVLVLTLALTPIILIVLVFRLCGRLLILLLPHHYNLGRNLTE